MGRVTDERVIAVVAEHAASLLRLARRHSLCEDDAADAYQRALEIYLERVDRVDHATVGPWLRTVCKHEAMRIRAARQRVLPAEDTAWDAYPSLDAREVDERAGSLERVAHAAEALGQCRPDQVRAMLLRADGSSYAEIAALCGWTYTKVNRCLSEGRARFLLRFGRIESGAACEDHQPRLSAIVDGEATPEDFAALRPHLRHCAGCRSLLKAMYESEPALRALVPAGALVLAAPGSGGMVARWYEAIATGLGDRVVRAHALIEAATSTKAAAVVVSTAAMAAGGAAAVNPTSDAVAAPGHARRVAAARAPAATPGPALSVTATPRPERTLPNRPAVSAMPPAAPSRTPRPALTPPPVARAEFAIEGLGPAPRPKAPSEDFAFEG